MTLTVEPAEWSSLANEAISGGLRKKLMGGLDDGQPDRKGSASEYACDAVRGVSSGNAVGQLQLRRVATARQTRGNARELGFFGGTRDSPLKKPRLSASRNLEFCLASFPRIEPPLCLSMGL